MSRPPVPSRRLLLLRACGALLAANARYWTGVAPLVRCELRRWRWRAAQIPDARLREVALCKLDREGFNVHVAATLATLAPRAHRARVTRAIVALEVLYDYLDGLVARVPRGRGRGSSAGRASRARAYARGAPRTGSPQTHLPAGDRELAGGRTLMAPLVHAVAGDGGCAPGGDRYAAGLAAAVRAELARLPGAHAAGAALEQAALRTVEGQVRTHAAAHNAGAMQALRAWAGRACAGSGLDWQELVAGAAASVLSMHALIALAADAQATAERAREVDRAYVAIAAVSTMLDSVGDYARDMRTGRPIPISWYPKPSARTRAHADAAPRAHADAAARVHADAAARVHADAAPGAHADAAPGEPAWDALPQRLRGLVAKALRRAAALPQGPAHAMIVTGVAACYISPRDLRDDPYRTLFGPVRGELRPLMGPTLALLRAWRAVHSRGTRPGAPSDGLASGHARAATVPTGASPPATPPGPLAAWHAGTSP